MRIFALLGLPLLLSLGAASAADRLDLAGTWRLRLDAEDNGVSASWPSKPLVTRDSLVLPNTTDRAGFGGALDIQTMLHPAPFPVTTRFPGLKDPVRADEHGYLVRRHLFVGPAWYEREVEIPEIWGDRTVVLRIERAMWQTEVWVDGRKAGVCDSLVAPHRHTLGVLTPGRHRLTVRVDNRMIHNLSTITHAYGPETQTRWNGMVGSLALEAAKPLSVRSVEVYPAPDRRSARVVVHCANEETRDLSGTMRIRLLDEEGERQWAETTGDLVCPPGRHTNGWELRWAEPALAWDEFHPVRYRVVAQLTSDRGDVDETIVSFGFRHLERVGQEIHLNGRRIFLRGTLDCAVYPRTGHPPMSVSEWVRVLGVVKEYGFNHVRFHTWCPPEAAFEVADRLGLYLQPEAPAWVDDWGVSTVTKPLGIGRDPEVVDYLRAEMKRMSQAYGNHPSFLFCAIGNEFGLRHTDWERVDAMVQEIKTLDPRRLYAGCGARRRLDADDFWFTHHTESRTRGIGPPHTDWDFAAAMEVSPVPLIAHETGQRPVFPDYEVLLPKFTGPLVPLQLERYRRALTVRGLAPRVKDFVRASARFQLTQYKAEHEGMLRTRGYSGYQLLMLNDFTGQSGALVGILDPFWESKGVISAAEVRTWNSPTVVLARFPKFVWTADETFIAQLEVAHYGPRELPEGPVQWTLETRRGQAIARGEHNARRVPVGGVSSLGTLILPLDAVRPPAALSFNVQHTGAANSWNLWVYPPRSEIPKPKGVLVAQVLNDSARRVLFEGGKVLLLAHGLKNASTAPSSFESVYWSAGWWGNRFSSLGVVCDPHHPALAAFPTDGWSDWQWQDLCKSATTFDLQDAPGGFRPIVQPVPDFHFNTLLAHVFEGKVGRGSLLVCGYDLTRDLDRRPAARQFRRSLFRYVGSSQFGPDTALSLDWLGAHVGLPSEAEDK